MQKKSLTKKVYIKTYGCQMNVYDSNKMLDLLHALGYEQTGELENSDLVILNTCHIREKASEKVYSELGSIRKFKEKRKASGNEMLIAVAGCVSQAEGDEIFVRAPYVDIVVGPQTYHNLPELIAKVSRDKKIALNLDFPAISKFDSLPETSLPQGYTAFLTIQEGCDKFCKFCCVPYTRGAEYSRNLSEIYREALNLVEQGAIEITLLGQNVSAYHGRDYEGNEINIAKLIEHLAKIPNLQRIRYTTSHPNDMTEDLSLLHKNEPKLMPFLHLPVQSGSDKILKDMNRKHTAARYLEIIKQYREACPDILFSSDFIVGYPGETEQDFEDTMELVRQVGFSLSYSFKYSMRPGTPAAAIEKQVPEDIKVSRLERLQALLTGQQNQINKESIGKISSVLFEKPGKYAGQILGKNQYSQAVCVIGSKDLIGKILPVKVEAVNGTTLTGVLV
ncbi:MAG: tRNA (N6-isopentenyl adenosine(37)-C2)-methylthiotransferase MiaB [Pseudomonadota bacterium]